MCEGIFRQVVFPKLSDDDAPRHAIVKFWKARAPTKALHACALALAAGRLASTTAEHCWAALSRQCAPIRSRLQPRTKDILMQLVFNARFLSRHDALADRARCVPRRRSRKDPLHSQSVLVGVPPPVVSDSSSDSSSSAASSSDADAEEDEVISASEDEVSGGSARVSSSRGSDIDDLHLGFSSGEESGA